MSLFPTTEAIDFKGQPCLRLSLPEGDTALIALHGAQVLSWVTADGVERLYLSPDACFDGTSAIRGGVPLCFPQFNNRVLAGQALPKHGFARTLPWAVSQPRPAPVGPEHGVSASLALTDNPATHALWPHAFAAELTVHLCPGSLQIGFALHNTDTHAWPFALALHTYLRVDDVAATALHGLQGQPVWDAVTHLDEPDVRSQQGVAALTFSGETDRVYSHVTRPVTVEHPGGSVSSSQSASLPELVVWNPAPALCSRLPDIPSDGWRHMLCVEAACIDTPVVLAPGQRWVGWQQLSAVPPQ